LKPELSSFDIAFAAAELNQLLKGFWISNIYQLNPRTLLLKLRGPEGAERNLILEGGRRVHTTSYAFEKPLKPPAFCMALRKYLRNGRIGEVQQYRFERIVEILVATKGGDHRVIVELFSKGNIILVGPDNKVLHALSYRRMRDRSILRGEAFVYPPSRSEDPRALQREDFRNLRNFGQLEVVRAVARFLGMGGTYAEEILLGAGVTKNFPCASLGDMDLDSIFDSLQKLLSVLSAGNAKPGIYIDEDGNWVDVAPIELKQYAHLKRSSFQTFNEALDEYYAKMLASGKLLDAKRLMEREVERLERILQGQVMTVSESKREAEVSRRIGDLIYRHLNELQFLLQSVMEDKRGGKSWHQIVERLEREKRQGLVPAAYFQTLRPETLSLQVSVEEQVFPLDIRLSAQRNGAQYYAEAKKAERKIGGVEKAIEETRRKIEKVRLQAVERVEAVSETTPKRRKRDWYEKFRWFFSSVGFLTVGGRDASTNEVLIRRHMEPQDVVFHADLPGAPFVLIKTGGKKPTEKTLKEAAQFAASYSRAWKEGVAAVDVYWVSPQQVSKTPPSGEYLPRGSFMIRGTKNYVKGVPLEISIGVKSEDGALQVVGGPTEAIVSQTKLLVALAPGKGSSERLARLIRNRLAQSASNEERSAVVKIPIEEIQRFIPAGGGSVK